MICQGCVFYHPRRTRKPCAVLPHVDCGTMNRCDMRWQATESMLAMRTRSEEEQRELRPWQMEIMETPIEARRNEI